MPKILHYYKRRRINQKLLAALHPTESRQGIELKDGGVIRCRDATSRRTAWLGRQCQPSGTSSHRGITRIK
jgi:hypothetical protein